MNERMRKLRKTLDLTQKEFAERIGIKQNTIATYEIGRSEPIDAVVSLICREFNVSETWLRTGEGEMFVPKEADALDELVKQYDLSGGDYALIEKFLKLKPSERKAVITYMKDVVSSLNEGTNFPSKVIASQKETTTPQPDIAAKVAELERQNQELADKVKALEEEDAIQETSSTSPSVSVGKFNPAEKAKI